MKKLMPEAYIKKIINPLKKPLALIALVTTNKKIGNVQPRDAIAKPMPYKKNDKYLFFNLFDFSFYPKLVKLFKFIFAFKLSR